MHPDWMIVGLRYFNVYGPREAHKGVPASMVYHLSRQMKAGQAPADFQTRRAETRFRLREGYRARERMRALGGERERNLQSRLGPGALVQRTDRRSEPFVRHELRAANTSRIRTRITRTSHQADLTNVAQGAGLRAAILARDRRGRLHELVVSRLTEVAQAMKAKRRSKSPEEINAALAAKKVRSRNSSRRIIATLTQPRCSTQRRGTRHTSPPAARC